MDALRLNLAIDLVTVLVRQLSEIVGLKIREVHLSPIKYVVRIRHPNVTAICA